jgi:arginine deiminase
VKFKTLEEAQAAHDAIEKELADANEVIADLRKDLTEVKKQKSAGKVFIDHNKKKYEVTAQKFSHSGKEYTADDLKANKELTKELVELGVGFLVEQE